MIALNFFPVLDKLSVVFKLSHKVAKLLILLSFIYSKTLL